MAVRVSAILMLVRRQAAVVAVRLLPLPMAVVAGMQPLALSVLVEPVKVLAVLAL